MIGTKSAIARAVAGTKAARADTYETTGTAEGAGYVLFDGAEDPTPATFAVTASAGDRVRIEVRKHKSYVIGNITASE